MGENIINQTLVSLEKNLFSTTTLKLDLKNSVQRLDSNGARFQFLEGMFPKINNTKIKEGTFVGPEIRKLMNDLAFNECLNEVKVAA